MADMPEMADVAGMADVADVAGMAVVGDVPDVLETWLMGPTQSATSSMSANE